MTPSPDLLTWMRDGIWQFGGFLVALITIVLTIVFTISDRRRSRKSLHYAILTRDLVRVDRDVKSRVQILFYGQPVASPYLLTLRVANTGRQPITRTDFDQPLVATITGTVMSATVAATSPPALADHLSWQQDSDSRLRFNALLLNPGDWFEIQVLTTAPTVPSRPLDLNTRIIGIDSPTPFDYNSLALPLWKKLGTYTAIPLAGALSAVLSLLLVQWLASSPPPTPREALLFTLGLAAFILPAMFLLALVYRRWLETLRPFFARPQTPVQTPQDKP
jgi:hypothetical protein